MIELDIYCSMCMKRFPRRVPGDAVQELSVDEIKNRLEKEWWILQVNGPNIDTYCCNKCAE